MKKGDRTIALSSFIAVLAMILGPWPQISSGEPNVENVPNFITGLENPPEDLLHIPYTSWIIASGMGIPGSLYAIDIETKSSKKLNDKPLNVLLAPFNGFAEAILGIESIVGKSLQLRGHNVSILSCNSGFFFIFFCFFTYFFCFAAVINKIICNLKNFTKFK